jgi:hypothetical protein
MITNNADSLVEFLRSVFDARGERRAGAPTGMRIGDSIIMISDGGGVRETMPAGRSARRLDLCHIGPDEPSPLQTQDDQPVEQFELDRRNDERIDAGDVGGVIAQESLPARKAWAATP